MNVRARGGVVVAWRGGVVAWRGERVCATVRVPVWTRGSITTAIFAIVWLAWYASTALFVAAGASRTLMNLRFTLICEPLAQRSAWLCTAVYRTRASSSTIFLSVVGTRFPHLVSSDDGTFT